MATQNNPVKNVFVIGPMFKEGEDKNGIAFKDQIFNIVRALNEIGAELKNDYRIELDVTAPDLRVNPIQNISNFVLGQIDRCDFAVADISARSPSVMYEIAILHALGTPVLLLDRKPVRIEDAIYYLKKLTVHEVESFSTANLRDVLDLPVKALCGVIYAGDADFAGNEITDYYDKMPLADIRAITGIATSFFSNYLRFMLDPQGPLRSDHTLDRFILLRPRRLVDNFGAKVRGRLEDAFGDRLEKKTETSVKFSRDFWYVRVGNAVVEYPTPLDSLIYSPQFIKTANRLTRIDPDGRGAIEFERYQKDIISAFERSISDLCRLNFNTIDPPEYMDIEEFFAQADQIGRP